jgi:hypothetical protein
VLRLARLQQRTISLQVLHSLTTPEHLLLRSKRMSERPRSAAASLYPHLKSGTPEPMQQRERSGTVADAMYAHLRPPAPKPPNPWRDSLLKHLRELNARHRASK